MTTTATSNDDHLAERLRREYSEQFNILVRMHLSFVLDLNTDESDALHEKGKLKKWGLGAFSKKSKVKGVMDGVPLTQEGICQVYQLIEFLRKEQNISIEGIFRRTGSLNRQQELRSLLNQGTTLNLDGGPYSVHDCASVLKGFLAELPEPLLTEAHYSAYCQIADLCGVTEKPAQKDRLLEALQLLLLLLPSENRVLLRDVLVMLKLTASYESSNKMSPASLATLFTPHLICPRKLSAETLHINYQTLSSILSFMIIKADELFNLPEKLAVDIQAFFADKERKKIKKTCVNESISDNFAANTVFRFVDIERTAMENESNPTETALAQLYAHIQSLPESAKKRKLVKQFNRENGNGTPLQVIRSGPIGTQKRGLGDSIKRHIFQKGIIKSVRRNGFAQLRSSSEEILSSPSITTTPSSRARLFCTKGGDDDDDDSDHSDVSIDDAIAKSRLRLATTTQTSLISANANDRLTPFTYDRLSSAVSNDRLSSVGNDRLTSIVDDSLLLLTADDMLTGSNSTIVLDDSFKSSLKRCASEPDMSGDDLTSRMVYLTSTPAPVAVTHCPQRPAAAAVVAAHSLFRSAGSGVTFAPDVELDRKSMSPITRSTQGMCRAMQETMMTPRSRKPVLLISGTNINKLPHMTKSTATTALTTTMEGVQEESISGLDSSENHVMHFKTQLAFDSTGGDKENNDNTDHTDNIDNIDNSDNIVNLDNHIIDNTVAKTPERDISLSSTFCDYLRSRSVLSPNDLSFASRPDDYHTTADMSASEMSDSLRACMDGQRPSTELGEIRRYSGEKEFVLKPTQFDENGKAIVFETSF